MRDQEGPGLGLGMSLHQEGELWTKRKPPRQALTSVDSRLFQCCPEQGLQVPCSPSLSLASGVRASRGHWGHTISAMGGSEARAGLARGQLTSASAGWLLSLARQNSSPPLPGGASPPHGTPGLAGPALPWLPGCSCPGPAPSPRCRKQAQGDAKTATQPPAMPAPQGFDKWRDWLLIPAAVGEGRPATRTGPLSLSWGPQEHYQRQVTSPL